MLMLIYCLCFLPMFLLSGSKVATARAKQLIAARVYDYYTGIGITAPDPIALTPEKETTVAEAHSAFIIEGKAVGSTVSPISPMSRSDRNSGTSSGGGDSPTRGHSDGAVFVSAPPPLLPSTSSRSRSPGSYSSPSSPPLPTDTSSGTAPSDAVIMACARHLDHKGVLSWLDVMRETGLWTGRLKPSTCVAINQCTGAKDAAGVVRWYHAVRKAGGNANEHTFNMAVKAFAYVVPL